MLYRSDNNISTNDSKKKDSKKLEQEGGTSEVLESGSKDTNQANDSVKEAAKAGTPVDKISNRSVIDDSIPKKRMTNIDEVRKPITVIAVSATKSPTTYCNLARKFLITEESIIFSALEGAIVFAIDAAQLLERSSIATIVRIETSYATVEARRRKTRTKTVYEPYEKADKSENTGTRNILETPQEIFKPRSGNEISAKSSDSLSSFHITNIMSTLTLDCGETTNDNNERPGQRRARIMITVRKTSSYRQWLIDNPQAGAEENDEVSQAKS